MNFSNTSWDKQTYKQFRQWLLKHQDIKYRDFYSKLILNEMPLIGIRTPLLHCIAKDISKGTYQDFFTYNRHYYYEENMIHGLILGYVQIDFQKRLELIEQFLPYNVNWAINDCVCANLKQFKTNQEIGFLWIKKLLKSNNSWNIRFGVVLLLNHYINDCYIDIVLKLSQEQYVNHYYVNMAIAWLLSICYIKYPEKIEMLLKKNVLDQWIQNKTISKIRDSHRVSKEKKDYLKLLTK